MQRQNLEMALDEYWKNAKSDEEKLSLYADAVNMLPTEAIVTLLRFYQMKKDLGYVVGAARHFESCEAKQHVKTSGIECPECVQARKILETA